MQSLGYLARKQLVPEAFDGLRRNVLPHGFDNLRPGDHAGLRKAIQNRLQTEEVVAVRMRDVDRRQAFPAGRDPIDQLLGGVDGEKHIDEHGVLLTGNESYCIWHPFQMLFPRGCISAQTSTVRDKCLPLERLRYLLHST